MDGIIRPPAAHCPRADRDAVTNLHNAGRNFPGDSVDFVYKDLAESAVCRKNAAADSVGVPAFPAFGPEHAETADNKLSVQKIPALPLIITMVTAADMATVRTDFEPQIYAGSFLLIDVDSVVSGIEGRLEMYEVVHYDWGAIKWHNKTRHCFQCRQAEEELTLRGTLFLCFVTDNSISNFSCQSKIPNQERFASDPGFFSKTLFCYVPITLDSHSVWVSRKIPPDL